MAFPLVHARPTVDVFRGPTSTFNRQTVSIYIGSLPPHGYYVRLWIFLSFCKQIADEAFIEENLISFV